MSELLCTFLVTWFHSGLFLYLNLPFKRAMNELELDGREDDYGDDDYDVDDDDDGDDGDDIDYGDGISDDDDSDNALEKPTRR